MVFMPLRCADPMVSGRVLSPAVRELFKEPVGTDVSDEELSIFSKTRYIIAVGDVVSLTVRKIGIVPLLSVYDGITERHELTEFADLVKNKGWTETVVVNPPGYITQELMITIENALAGRSEMIIRVEGEEDLAVIPCILFAPEGSVIVYGWPGRGMKAVLVDGPIQKHIRHLYDMMEESK